MRQDQLRIFLFVCLYLTLAGCSTSKPTTLPPAPLSKEAELFRAAIIQLKPRARFRITEDKAVTATFQVQGRESHQSLSLQKNSKPCSATEMKTPFRDEILSFSPVGASFRLQFCAGPERWILFNANRLGEKDTYHGLEISDLAQILSKSLHNAQQKPATAAPH